MIPTEIAEEIRAVREDRLKELDLSGQLLGLPKEVVAQILVEVCQLTNLTTLDVSGNRLGSLPEGMSRLTKLTTLAVSGNSLGSLPEWMSQLTNLQELRAYDNLLSALPSGLGLMSSLKILDLSGNKFKAIPTVVYELHGLKQLSFINRGSFDNRNEISEIAPEILQMESLQTLDLTDNPMQTPPPEIVEEGVEAIKDYFRQLAAEDEDYLYEAKLLIVGEGGAGKTSLAKKIANPAYQLCEEDSTKGIDVIRWQFPLANGRDFQVNIWDFGGQEIYHATHQFFLTKRSLYALVADTRKEDTDFYYWLNVVELLSENSPLLIVKNEKQNRQREINETQLRGQFSSLEKTLSTNLSDNRGLPEILEQVKHYISHLPHIGTPLPKTWVKVREVLEKDPRNHITLEEYLRICEKNKFHQGSRQLQLSGYLHDLGVCLHFQDDDLLNKTVILKPSWGTAAVYHALDSETTRNNRGRFTRADLARIWHEECYADSRAELLQLMVKFKLCYQLPGDANTYIASHSYFGSSSPSSWGAI